MRRIIENTLICLFMLGLLLPFSVLAQLSSIQPILDAVSIDSLNKTVEHLSGESPFWIDGHLDSIMTRYSYNPEIFKAQEYIQSRLEDMGYEVGLQPFSFAAKLWIDVQFAPDDENIGWLTSRGSIYGTSDGGRTWRMQYSSDCISCLWSVFPLNHKSTYSVGESGCILKTSDGGDTWEIQTSSTNVFLHGVFFIDENSGWVCGDGGTVLRTTDGGLNWILINTSGDSRLYDIFFVDARNGWTAGSNGTILHTTDSGETWTYQHSERNARLYGVHFIHQNIGFIVGGNGIVLKTEDAGQSWSPVDVLLYDYYDVDFLESDRGLIVGSEGICLLTTDGGASWRRDERPTDRSNIYSCDILDVSAAWICGPGILATITDSGISKQKTSMQLEGVSLNNIIATKTGSQYPDKFYIICAHYDDLSKDPMTRAPGADDNASGTAAVIEAARVLADYEFNYSIKFLLVPGEEQGLRGSAFYALQAAQSGEKIGGVINLDMIGYDANGDGVFELHSGTMADSLTLGDFAASKVSDFTLDLTPEIITTGATGASDHRAFWDMGYPAILFIEDLQEDFSRWYHTTGDLLSTLNPTYFLNLSRLAIGSLASLAEIDLTGHYHKDIPTRFVFYDPYPNPFNSNVNIGFYLPSSEKVSVEIYDVLGRRVKQICDEYRERGYHNIRWDGRDNDYSDSPSGLYVIRIQTDTATSIKKAILMR